MPHHPYAEQQPTPAGHTVPPFVGPHLPSVEIGPAMGAGRRDGEAEELGAGDGVVDADGTIGTGADDGEGTGRSVPDEHDPKRGWHPVPQCACGST